MFARLVTTLVFDIQTSVGKTKVPAQVNLVWLVFLVPALLLGVHLGGITGAAAAHAAAAAFVAVPIIVWSLARSGITLRPIVPARRRILLAGLVSAVVMVAVARTAADLPLVQVLVGGRTSLAAHLVVPAADRSRLFTLIRARSRPKASV
jgi:PST family polysaccharide transporter